MSTISITSKAVAFGDSQASSQPLRKNFDWTRSLTATIADPDSAHRRIEVGGSHTFFNGARNTTVAADTAFGVAPSTLGGGRYRFTHTGGTNPTLRTSRNLTLTGQQVTVTANSQTQVANFALGGGTFGGTVVGDIIFIPHVSTGDATSVFSIMNAGFWQVLAVVSATQIQVQRLPGEDFVGVSEVVTLASNDQLRAFSAAGVQVGDSVNISAAFAPATQRTFEVASVTETWFEVISTTPIPTESGKTPTATGIVWYTDGKQFLRVEADQEVVVRLNGDSTDIQRLSPLQAGDPENVAWFEKWGPVWSLTVVNKGSSSVVVDVFSA